jgi:hypothetical protein
LCERERFGLQRCRLGEFVERAGVAVEAGGVPGLGGELGEERAVAVRGLAGGSPFCLRLLLRGGRADGFRDGVGTDRPSARQ